MAINVGIDIIIDGLLRRALQQTLAGRESLVIREKRAKAEEEGIRKRVQQRKLEGRDEATGEPLPSLLTRIRSDTKVKRLDEEPGANSVGGVSWGMGWVYVNLRKWERLLEEEAEEECPIVGTAAPTEVSVEIFSGARNSSVRLNFLSDFRLVHDLILPVVNDKFVYIAIGYNDEIGQFTGAAALVGFNSVAEVSLSQSAIDTIANSDRSFAMQLGRVGWLTYGSSNMYSPNLGGDLSCDFPTGFQMLARNFPNRQGSGLPFGYVLGSPASYSVYGLTDQWDSGRPAHDQGMRTPPIQLSDNPLGGWVPKCVPPEKYTVMFGEVPQETTVFFPSSYGIFKSSAPQAGFAVKAANLPAWKGSYLGASYQEPSNFINEAAKESRVRLRGVSPPPNLTPFSEDLSSDPDRLITFFNDPTADGQFIDNAICVSVIDETSPGIEVQTADWNAFRAKWPTRPFFVLVPPSPEEVILPAGWDGTRIGVNREPGVSDWFNLMGLGNLDTRPLILLFIDNSGSMTTADVIGSLDLFRQRCKENCFQIGATIANTSERYILPFIDLAVSTNQFYERDPDKGKFYCLLSNPWNKNWSGALSSLGISISTN
jgi:hypothetical protein